MESRRRHPLLRRRRDLSHRGDWRRADAGAAPNALTDNQQLTWVDRAGKPLGTVGPAGEYENPRLAPDGQMMSVALQASGASFEFEPHKALFKTRKLTTTGQIGIGYDVMRDGQRFLIGTTAQHSVIWT